VDEVDGMHSGMIEAARLLFCKRTRTLYRWMYPNIKKHELNKRVADAWDSAAEEEKKIYLSQVAYFVPIARRSHFTIVGFMDLTSYEILNN
jgi:hypothetical protein